jgi:hypothetical protein
MWWRRQPSRVMVGKLVGRWCRVTVQHRNGRTTASFRRWVAAPAQSSLWASQRMPCRCIYVDHARSPEATGTWGGLPYPNNDAHQAVHATEIAHSGMS